MLDVRLPAHEISDSDPSRFRWRSDKSGSENAPLRWVDATAQAIEGWRPAPSSADGEPLEWRSGRRNVAYRIGVLQADKLPACGDLKRSMANVAFTVETPIMRL